MWTVDSGHHPWHLQECFPDQCSGLTGGGPHSTAAYSPGVLLVSTLSTLWPCLPLPPVTVVTVARPGFPSCCCWLWRPELELVLGSWLGGAAVSRVQVWTQCRIHQQRGATPWPALTPSWSWRGAAQEATPTTAARLELAPVTREAVSSSIRAPPAQGHASIHPDTCPEHAGLAVW